jgi:hypothetical protein
MERKHEQKYVSHSKRFQNEWYDQIKEIQIMYITNLINIVIIEKLKF